MASRIPQKSNSLRAKARPAARIGPFRDDTSLVGVRYEETKQATPPIPLPPPRNPLRAFRPCSTITANGSPIVIPSPLEAPPREQHPLFRTHYTPEFRADEWKRDSGAPTSSSVTIQGELEEDFGCKVVDEPYKITPLFSGEAKPPSTLYTLPRRAPEPPAVTPCLEIISNPTSPIDINPDSRMFGKNSSSTPTRRLRKKALSDVTHPVTVKPVSPSTASSIRPTWGSLKSPKSPKSPKSTPTTAGGAPPRPTHTTSDADGSRGSISSSIQFDTAFMPLTTEIPTDSLLASDLFEQLEFSKRGSIMFGGKRSALGPLAQKPAEKASVPATTRDAHDAPGSLSRAIGGDGASSTVPSIRVLSVDVERESQKVRSLYDSTESVDWNEGARASTLVEHPGTAEDAPSTGEENAAHSSPSSPPFSLEGESRLRTPIPHSSTPMSGHSLSQRQDKLARREYELAGGLEDWEDVTGADVDRYGFISERKLQIRPAGPDITSDGTHLSPTKRRGILGIRPSSSYAGSPFAQARVPTRKVSARSLNTQNTDRSTASRRSARGVVRQASNRLPHNRGRRWMDEAGDMLNTAPGLTDIEEEELTEKQAEALKRKEWERAEKWKKMAKVTKDGKGMGFEFDVKNQKLIDRTWKGIPDRWRAAAWYSFLATSARNMGDKEEEEDLFSQYHHLQKEPSPDDVQIDLDVPRTINRHIMFRKRYRGGQRLLFRVLHAMSIHFPDTGYVQGMASLAATLLCYFDEEKTFVMLVRMWRYRGLERLYQPGFDGLMAALGDFQRHWLGPKEVARKLEDLAIDTTAYGTRWYLTLFNLSIPFPAQLRVWDVFMLLGECSTEPSGRLTTGSSKGKEAISASLKGLDVLHATSAALIDALREVLLDSDFENAMKALTSWISIKDEEMLMKVTRAEWKQHQTSKKPWDALRPG